MQSFNYIHSFLQPKQQTQNVPGLFQNRVFRVHSVLCNPLLIQYCGGPATPSLWNKGWNPCCFTMGRPTSKFWNRVPVCIQLWFEHVKQNARYRNPSWVHVCLQSASRCSSIGPKSYPLSINLLISMPLRFHDRNGHIFKRTVSTPVQDQYLIRLVCTD